MKKNDFLLLDILAHVLSFLVGVLSVILVIGLCLLASCTTARPAPADALPATAAQVALPDSVALPPYLVPAPAGSTPRQRRQWQRAQTQNLARAGVLPTKVKNSSVATAPGAVAITRPSSPVAIGASTATDARKAGTRGGSVAVGPGAVATNASTGVSWWWYVLAAVGGAVLWEYVSSRVAPLRAVLKWRA